VQKLEQKHNSFNADGQRLFAEQLAGRAHIKMYQQPNHTGRAMGSHAPAFFLLDELFPTPPSPKEPNWHDGLTPEYLERARLLAILGWPEPLVVASGNGYYLLYRTDLPNDAASTDVIRRALHGLANWLDTQGAKIDLTPFNASRIIKIAGTTARKAAPTRPTAGVLQRCMASVSAGASPGKNGCSGAANGGSLMHNAKSTRWRSKRPIQCGPTSALFCQGWKPGSVVSS